MTPSCASMPRNGATGGGSRNAGAAGAMRAEQRRAEQDARDDLADHRRLADAAGRAARRRARR